MAKITITAMRLRNLTTGILHTDIGDVYRDLGTIAGVDGLMTHQLPRVLACVTPWLKDHVKDPWMWEKKHDPKDDWELTLPEPTQADRAVMLENYKAMPDPLAGKATIAVVVDGVDSK